MGHTQQRPILITGAGRRIGLALAHHFLNLRHPVIVSYRTEYPSIEGLRHAGAVCIQADFSTDEGILAFAEKVKSTTPGLRAVIHNASTWLPEKAGHSLSETLACMMQIHVNAPYLLNHALQDLLRGHGHAAGDIIHFTDYVVERGSDKHIAYAASKAAIAPAMILFNEGDDAEYRQQALNKSLMKIAPGEKEVIDLIDYLLTSCYVTGRTFAVDGGRPLR